MRQIIPLPNNNLVHQLIKNPVWYASPGTRELTNLEMRIPVTKRELLRNLASIYDRLGLLAPVTLTGKIIYRETCKAKTAWDAPPPKSQATEYSQWVKGLPDRDAITRAPTIQREAV